MNEKQARVAIQAIYDLGFDHVRWDVPWQMAEEVRSQISIPPLWDFVVDHARSKGIESILILDYGNKLYGNGRRPLSASEISAFADYAEFVVRHFNPRVQKFEIWNEWDQGNGGSGAGTAAEYVALVREVYPRIKWAAPEALVLAGGASRGAMDSMASKRRAKKRNSYFFEEFVNLGGHRWADALSIHAYSYAHSEHAVEGELKSLVSTIDDAISKSEFPKKLPIFITEFGWTTEPGHAGRSASPEVQANHLSIAIKEFTKLRCNNDGVVSITVFELIDQPGDMRGGYGVISGGGQYKPSAYAIRKILRKNYDLNI